MGGWTDCLEKERKKESKLNGWMFGPVLKNGGSAVEKPN
jgi:hypothetical protein